MTLRISRLSLWSNYIIWLSVVGCRLWVCPIPIRITITLPLCQQPLPSFAIVCNISAPPCASRVTGWFPIEKKQRNEHDNQAIPYISDYGNNVNKLAEIVFYEDESDTAKAHGTVENPRLLSFSYNGNAEYLYIKVINGGSTKGLLYQWACHHLWIWHRTWQSRPASQHS